MPACWDVSSTKQIQKLLGNDLFSTWKYHIMLLAANGSTSSFWANSGFPHLTNTQQTQESGNLLIASPITVIPLVSTRHMPPSFGAIWVP